VIEQLVGGCSAIFAFTQSAADRQWMLVPVDNALEVTEELLTSIGER
jgi:hypothetical protein